MGHQIQNFEIHAGDDLVVPIEVTDNGRSASETTNPGTPINLTGVTEIVFAVADRDESSTRIITFKLTTTGIVITDAVAGKYEARFLDSDTFGLFGFKDMQSRVTDSVGDKFTAFAGLLNINKSILTATE